LTGFDDDGDGGGKPSFVVIDDFEFVVVVNSIGNDNLPDKFFGGVDGRVFVINFASLGNAGRPNAKEDVFSESDIQLASSIRDDELDGVELELILNSLCFNEQINLVNLNAPRT